MFESTKNMGGKIRVKTAANKVIHKLLTFISQPLPLCHTDNRLLPHRQQTIATQTTDYCLPDIRLLPTDKHLRIYKNIRYF